MISIPTCIIGGSDASDIPFIINELETLLVKDIVNKIIYKEYYFVVYFNPMNDCIDRRISRFIYTIQNPLKYIILHYKNEEMKSYTYIKKAPYKML